MVSSHDVRTIYEDDYLLVIDKPSGLVVDNSETQKEGTLEDWLMNRHSELGSESRSRNESGMTLERSGIVHRLDKDTSGILLVAKTKEALENLQAQFKERKTKKEYLSLVHGLVESPGMVEGDIGRNPGNREKFTVLEDGGGKEAVTEYEPERNFQFLISNFQSIFNDLNKIQMRKLGKLYGNGFTLLRCFPKTGRTHQIRVHLKYINHPVVCDEKYVGRKMFRLDRRWCPRLFLHAKSLGFYHPKSGEWMEMESELPEDLSKVLTSFEQ